MIGRGWSERAPLVPVLLFVLLVVALPLAYLLGSSVANAGGAAAVRAVLADPLDRVAFANSLEQGLASAAIAGAVGYPVGLMLGRYRFVGRDTLQAFLLLPFLLPSLVVILGFQELFGPTGWLSGPLPALGALAHGIPGIIAVNVYFNASLVALLTATALAGSSRAQEEAVALLGGSPFRAYREVWGPLSLLGAAAGMLLTFLLSAMGFAPPLVICGARCYTLEVRIWSLSEVLGDPAAAGVLGLLAILLLVVPTVAYFVFLDRSHRRTGGAPPPPKPLTRRSGVLALAGAAYLVLFFAGIAVLVVAVVARSLLAPAGGLSATGWAELFSPTLTAKLGISTAGAVANSLFFATGAALVALLLALAAGYARRRGAAGGPGLDALLFLPILASPVILAFGLATFWRPWLGGGTNIWVLILVSQAAIALPFALQNLRLTLERLPRAPWEAARTLGRSPFGAFLDVELPRVRAGLTAAALFAFAIGLGEFTATFFLYLPPFTTLPVELLLLGQLRLTIAASAAGALLALVSLLTFVAIERGGRRLEL